MAPVIWHSASIAACLSTTLPSTNSLLSSALSWMSSRQTLPLQAKVSQKAEFAISCLRIPGCRTNCVRLWFQQVLP